MWLPIAVPLIFFSVRFIWMPFAKHFCAFLWIWRMISWKTFFFFFSLMSLLCTRLLIGISMAQFLLLFHCVCVRFFPHCVSNFSIATYAPHIYLLAMALISQSIPYDWKRFESDERRKEQQHTHTHMHRIRIGPTMPIIQFNVTMMVYRFSSGWHARFWNI